MDFSTLTPDQILKLVAIAGATIACITDMTTGKIKNWLTFPMMVGGVIANTVLFGWSGLIWSIIGLILGILVYLPLAVFGFVGMGDVKLLSGIGSVAGPGFMFVTLLYGSVAAIPHALIIQWLNYGKDALKMFATSFTSGAWKTKTIHDDNATVRYHFYMGLSLWIGALAAWFFPLNIRW